MSPRPRSTEKDEQILEAASELFAAAGFANVTIPEVAARAGVGLGTLYLRFPSKEALGNAVFRWCKRAWAAATLDDWPLGAPPSEQFHAYWSRLQSFAERQRDKARYLENQPIGHELDPESIALREELSRRSTAFVRGWIDSGEVLPLPIEIVVALIHGTFWRIADLPLSPRRRSALLQKARDAVWRAMCRG
jgi:AcrR family transcriptional regulator